MSCATELPAAVLKAYYPQFSEVEVPAGTSAIRAWYGRVRPFRDEYIARAILRLFEADMALIIDQGEILPDDVARTLPSHWCEPLLVSMNMVFEVLLLDFEVPQHPRIYCVSPRICRRTFPCHPHLRDDISIAIGRGPLPALCIYSAAEHIFTGEEPRIVQFLDQSATYLAKHLIWTRTRRLYGASDGRVIRAPSPGELIVDCEARIRTFSGVQVVPEHRREWHGYWAGLTAASGLKKHLETIDSTKLCWCGSGVQYGECHRPRELALFLSRTVP